MPSAYSCQLLLSTTAAASAASASICAARLSTSCNILVRSLSSALMRSLRAAAARSAAALAAARAALALANAASRPALSSARCCKDKHVQAVIFICWNYRAYHVPYKLTLKDASSSTSNMHMQPCSGHTERMLFYRACSNQSKTMLACYWTLTLTCSHLSAAHLLCKLLLAQLLLSLCQLLSSCPGRSTGQGGGAKLADS